MERAAPERRRSRAGLRYVLTHPELNAPLVLLFLFALGWQEEVLLPMLARVTFDASAGLFALFASALAVGAVVGA